MGCSLTPEADAVEMLRPIVPVLIGPTAAGKTEISLHLAQLLRAEILSADSRQVYRFLDIGTAKPTVEDRHRIVHHFIDERDPDEPFSAGEFGSLGRDRIRQVQARGRRPLVVGGSGLYVRSLIDGLFEGPGPHHQLRAVLEDRARMGGMSELLEELRNVDPEAARGATAATARRIIRALEVYHATGVPLSTHQRRAKPTIEFTPVLFGLQWERQELYRRIALRCASMVAGGLLEESERLEAMGYGPSCNALNTVGYVEMAAYRRGQLSWNEALERFQRNTRRYAKRQMTWFRADSRIRWIPMSGAFDPAGLAEQIAALCADATP